MNGILFRPVWPRTVKCPTARQTGETCVTVKTTGAAAGNRNVSVVRRSPFGPCSAIQGRELRKRAIDDLPCARPGDADEGPEPAPDEDDEPRDSDRAEAMPASGGDQT